MHPKIATDRITDSVAFASSDTLEIRADNKYFGMQEPFEKLSEKRQSEV